jgi:catalase
MSIKFHMPDGSDTDMVINSLKFFPVANGEGFRDLFLAIAASPPDAPQPTPIERFLATHPAAPAAFATVATPDNNKIVDLDVLTITNVVPDSGAVQKQLLFLPDLVTDGIEPSDDPLFATRDAANPISFAERNQ